MILDIPYDGRHNVFLFGPPYQVGISHGHNPKLSIIALDHIVGYGAIIPKSSTGPAAFQLPQWVHLRSFSERADAEVMMTLYYGGKITAQELIDLPVPGGVAVTERVEAVAEIERRLQKFLRQPSRSGSRRPRR